MTDRYLAAGRPAGTLVPGLAHLKQVLLGGDDLG